MSSDADRRDTIVAIATPPGHGGIGVVRLSGPRSRRIARRLSRRAPRPRRADYVHFRRADGTVIDDGLLLCFPGPRSFTGEDVVELQAHGSPALLAELVERCIELGARHARAGEFSERAFLEGRIDLAQAEAIADLIAAGSAAQARAARRSLSGEFSRRVTQLLQALIRLRVWIEAALDFPEEEIDFLADQRLVALSQQLRADLSALLAEAERGQRLTDGLHVVLLGRPNAGKSSLLNALAGDDRAIVTEVAGTTRDLLRETVRIDGVELTLVDTAGLRDAGDAIESEGIRRARAELARADLALVVVDASRADPTDDLLAEVPPGAAIVVLHNKADLLADDAATPANVPRNARVLAEFRISARHGRGLDPLRALLRDRAGATEGGSFSARARHVDALRRVTRHLADAESQLAARHGELAGEELRLAQQALAEITGEFRSDDLLGEIFGSFCIGK